jgi:hypothetical protein
MSTLPTTVNRTAALGQMERKPCSVLELTIDKCTNTYGVAPCTATGAVGSECYNTYATCQAKAAYAKGSQIVRFVSRGVQSPLGQTYFDYVTAGYVTAGYSKEVDSPLRPYLLSSITAPTNLDFEAGLAPRNTLAITLADEPDNDSDQDPYYATRPTPPNGTFWSRFIGRNRNYFGRSAKLRRGFVASPWDWTLFLDELYIIDSLAVDATGQIKLTLKDPLALTAKNMIPLATNGTAQNVLKAIEETGMAAAGTTATITLDTNASAVDGYYNGMEVWIYTGTAGGERRVVSGYVGATRVATMATAWAVAPDTTSAYQVSGLSVTVETGLGAQYNDPATSGKPEYVRLGSEIIQYTVKSGDKLSWPDATYRAQFGSIAADHKVGDGVQQCRAYVNQSVQNVLTSLLTESGIAAGYVSSSLATDCGTWYGTAYNITACISAPEDASKLLVDLLKQIGAVMWWSPQTQAAEFKAIMPSMGAFPTWNDSANLIQGGTQVQNLDTLRITQSAISYSLKDATANLQQPQSYLRTDVVVDLAAQSAIEYGDVRPELMQSRWFTNANAVAMKSMVQRRVNRMRDAPKLFTLKIDPKDYTQPIGAQVAISTFRDTDAAGNPNYNLCIISRLQDMGTHIEVQARNTNFKTRYGFIAPAGQPDYSVASVAQRNYAYIAGAGETMSDGSSAYLII